MPAFLLDYNVNGHRSEKTHSAMAVILRNETLKRRLHLAVGTLVGAFSLIPSGLVTSCLPMI